jgi:hypothetical protein
MQEVLEDDNMIFNMESLKNYLSFEQNKGFIVKTDDEIVGFAYCYELLCPDGKNYVL